MTYVLGLKNSTRYRTLYNLHIFIPFAVATWIAATTVGMAFTSLLFGVFLLVAAGLGLVQPYASGPSVDDGFFNQTCYLMTPLHNDLAPTAGSGGYSIETELPYSQGYTCFKYTAGKEYTGTIDTKPQRLHV